LNESIVAQTKAVAMEDETMLFTANKQGSVCVVLSSDKSTKINPFGIDNIEMLMNK